MNIPPQSIQALRDVPDGVPRLFMHHRPRHQRAAAATLGGAERSTHPLCDAFATRAAAPFDQADDAVLIAIPAPRTGSPPIQFQ
ncbi:hypothetical protein CEW87_18015 [Parazoarcus communis]|uniref:Uncharacterized protein n=1 Tax=Parazoarcus communis TaxID=41977 RepID=A0A2U8H616_9RHOO|nr:hypothetical protein CEW87_18015 [Parazoarcus communis]